MNIYTYLKSRLSKLMTIALTALVISAAVPSKLHAADFEWDPRLGWFFAKSAGIVATGVAAVCYGHNAYATSTKPARITRAEEEKRNLKRTAWIVGNSVITLGIMAKAVYDTPKLTSLDDDQLNREAGWLGTKLFMSSLYLGSSVLASL